MMCPAGHWLREIVIVKEAFYASFNDVALRANDVLRNDVPAAMMCPAGHWLREIVIVKEA